MLKKKKKCVRKEQSLAKLLRRQQPSKTPAISTT